MTRRGTTRTGRPAALPDGGETLENSLQVLRPGGKVISVAGPPEPNRQRVRGELVLNTSDACPQLSDPTENQTPRGHLLVLVHASKWRPTTELGSLIDSGVIRPLLYRVFPFKSKTDALAYIEKAAKGKAVIKVR